jgi:hypothetical protein
MPRLFRHSSNIGQFQHRGVQPSDTKLTLNNLSLGKAFEGRNNSALDSGGLRLTDPEVLNLLAGLDVGQEFARDVKGASREGLI